MEQQNTSYEMRISKEKKEIEPRPEVPIINIIRHGATDYKELQNPDFTFDPNDPSFEFDTEHLDLNEQGIQDILETAEQMGNIIDKDNEAVLVITSPNFRAQSSALLLESELRKRYVMLLNPDRDVRQADNLRQINLQDKTMSGKWIKADQKYRSQDSDRENLPPDIAHEEIAESLNQELTDIFTEDYEEINLRFNRFMRHMINLNDWLSPETKEAIKNKKLRVISVTHEELPTKFMQNTLGTKENLKKGQILELYPEDFLTESGEIQAKVTLYKKGDQSESGEANIAINFTPDSK